MGLAAKSYAAHYTISEWEKWNDQWELIDGVPYCMSPAPTVKHQDVGGNIYTELKSKLKNCNKCKAYLPIDWQITNETVVQPDVLVVCKEITTKRLQFTPTLIFEILSPSTARKDKTEKFELYQAEGVKYYCMVNPDNKEIELFVLIDGVYAKQDVSSFFVFELDECTVDFNFNAIW